jgi:hypothetical protein
MVNLVHGVSCSIPDIYDNFSAFDPVSRNNDPDDLYPVHSIISSVKPFIVSEITALIDIYNDLVIDDAGNAIHGAPLVNLVRLQLLVIFPNSSNAAELPVGS